MLGIFKTTSWRINGNSFTFFQKVFSQLPNEFTFLLSDLNRGLYVRFSDRLKSNRQYSIGFDPSQSDQSMIKGKQFILKGISIKHEGEVYPLTLTIYDGLWVAFHFSANVRKLSTFDVDVSSIIKEKLVLGENTEINKLVSGLASEQLELNDLTEIEIDGMQYYQIKDIGDGNVIAINRRGEVYGLIHRPYKIELLNRSVKLFVADVNNGAFNLDGYASQEDGYA